MESHNSGVRSEIPATAALGTLAALALGGYLLSRRNARRRRPVSPRAAMSCSALVEESMNLLAAVRGYCEIAKIKGENGTALARRMDASLHSIDEVSHLLRQLLGVVRTV